MSHGSAFPVTCSIGNPQRAPIRPECVCRCSVQWSQCVMARVDVLYDGPSVSWLKWISVPLSHGWSTYRCYLQRFQCVMAGEDVLYNGSAKVPECHDWSTKVPVCHDWSTKVPVCHGWSTKVPVCYFWGGCSA